MPLLAAEQAAHAATLAVIREQVVASAFALAWADGEAMDMAHAVAYALEEADDA